MAIQNRRGSYADFDPTKMLPGEFAVVLSNDPSDNSGYAVYMCFASGVVKRLVFSEQLALRQDALTFDNTPTSGSNNPVKSSGIAAALSGKQNILTYDSTPTAGSPNPVTSSGIKTALDGKQNTLTFDTTPTASSTKPVTSGGIKTYVDNAVEGLEVITFTDPNSDGNIVISFS